MKNHFEELPIDFITPEMLEKFFSEYCIKYDEAMDVNNEKFEITFDYSFLAPPIGNLVKLFYSKNVFFEWLFQMRFLQKYDVDLQKFSLKKQKKVLWKRVLMILQMNMMQIPNTLCPKLSHCGTLVKHLNTNIFWNIPS